MPAELQLPLTAATRYCAVFGHPIKHSASPAMQNAGFAALGLDWRYLAFEVRPERLREAILGAKEMHFIGLNLTVPHKLVAVDIVDHLDESAKTWGAVNTIRFEGRDADGPWLPLREFTASLPAETRTHGFNTDASAITRSLREDLDLSLRGAKVILLGTGGAGRTAALKLASEGIAELWLVNRTQSKAIDLADEIQRRHPEVKVRVGFPDGQVDLLLNATSKGLKPDDGSPLDGSSFPLKSARCVYDMIYRPARTPLLHAAEIAGCRNSNGLGMLLYQGAEALEIWSGKTAPITEMRAALLKHINEH